MAICLLTLLVAAAAPVQRVEPAAAVATERASTPGGGTVVAASSAPTWAIGEGKGRVTLLLHATNGSPELALSAITFAQGMLMPEHAHTESCEIIYAIDGQMELLLGGERITVTAGTAVRIPKGVKHAGKVTATMRVVQIYDPAGPEQRFTSGTRIH